MLRDQIKSLQAVLHRQYVSSTREADVDIIAAVVFYAAVRQSGVSCAAVCTWAIAPTFRKPPGASGRAKSWRHLWSSTPAAINPYRRASYSAPGRWMRCQRGCRVCKRGRRQWNAWLAMAENNARLAMTSRKQAKTRFRQSPCRARGRCWICLIRRVTPNASISATRWAKVPFASCVVCVDGAMKKSDYRRFNISGITGGDDYAAMRQALTRRYQKIMHSGIDLDGADGASDAALVPDLVLIDGGKGQHGIAREVFAELGLDHLQSVGVAKGEGRKPGLETLFVHGRSEPLQLAAGCCGAFICCRKFVMASTRIVERSHGAPRHVVNPGWKTLTASARFDAKICWRNLVGWIACVRLQSKTYAV